MSDADHAQRSTGKSPNGKLAGGKDQIDFQTAPERYRHWKLSIDGDVATLAMDVDEKAGLFEGYDLKLNSYDLGVDIELADAIERLRFEYPQARALVLRSARPRVFSAGANIRMLAGASHAHKVNFCKFTNETRNGIEDLSANSGLKSICAINGTAAGGGYELALATDYIMLVDDGSASVSLPELPLLAVLPGTGGLTRVSDKRKVRARSRRRVLHHRRRRQRQARGRMAARRRRGARLEIRRDHHCQRQGLCRAIAAHGERPWHQARAADAHIRRSTVSNTAHSRSNSRVRSASRPSPCVVRRRRRLLRPMP